MSYETLIISILLIFQWAPFTNSYCLERSDYWYECSNMTATQLKTEINFMAEFLDLQVLNFTNSNLDTITEKSILDKQTEVHTLSITNCNVSKIAPKSFNNFPKLSYFSLFNNNIEHIDGNIFESDLQILNITYNNIRSISNICIATPVLSEIYLDNNDLTRIESDDFKNCSNVGVLSLNNCNIYFIVDDGFTEMFRLKYLDLSNNYLAQLNFKLECTSCKLNLSFNSISKVKTDYLNMNQIDLSFNQVFEFERNGAVLELELKELLLNSNNISYLTRNFLIDFPYMSILKLNNNPIKTIEQSVFNHTLLRKIDLSNSLQHIGVLSNVTFLGSCTILELFISNAGLYSIEPNTFTTCNNLNTLDLSNNNISKLEINTFVGLQSLSKINLTGNKILVIEPQAFNGLDNLGQIDVQSFSQLEHIYTNQFEGLTSNSLEELDLSGHGLKSINSEAFENLNFLKTLFINYSHIEHLPEFTFSNIRGLNHLKFTFSKVEILGPNVISHLPQLFTLNLTSSRISEISSDAFNYLNSLCILDLSYNNISITKPGMFHKLNNLNNLNLQGNSIKTLSSYSFIKLLKLQVLSLWPNPITEIEPNAFYDFQMYEFNFNSFPIKTIKSGAFHGLNSMQRLNLSQIGIDVIEEEAFCGMRIVRRIYLENNNITVVPKNCFYGLNLVELHLSNNSIQHLDDQAFFGVNINNLSLAHNQIGKLPSNIFKHLNSNDPDMIYKFDLEWLNLKNAGITELQPKTFEALSELLHLDMNGNYLHILETHSFFGLNKLLKLDLRGNPITEIKNNTFLGLRALKQLLLSNVNLTISSNTFQHLNQVTHLTIQYSNINKLMSGSFNLVSLEILNMSFNVYETIENGTFMNSKIRVLDMRSSLFLNNTLYTNTFDGLVMLETLYLENCNISTLESRTFSNLTLKKLYLQNNNLHKLPSSSFLGLNELSELYLQNNNFQIIACMLFAGLDNLKILNLASNDIKTIDLCGFQFFSNLQELHLEHNHLSILKIGTFAALDSLRYLNISTNILKDFNPLVFYNMPELQYLDISNNYLYTRSFIHIFKFSNTLSHMKNLIFVGLNHNGFPCNNLIDFLNFLKEKRIKYKPSYNYRYDTMNIDGIPCSKH